MAAAAPPRRDPPEASSREDSPRDRLRSRPDDDPEEELWAGGYSPRAMAGPAAVVVAVSLVAFMVAGLYGGWEYVLPGVFLLWIGLAAVLAYRRMDVGYRLTSQQLFHKKGILRRVTDRIEVIDMDDIRFTQGVVERVLGIGTVSIISSDRSHPELVLRGIEDVQRVAGLIDHARRKERIRRGLHIESV